MPDFDPDETSRPVSANFFARPDGRLIRDAIRAVVDVGADTVYKYPLVGRQVGYAGVNQSQALRRLDDRARLLAGGLERKV